MFRLEGAVHRPRFQAAYRQILPISWLASCLIQLILDAERQGRLKYVIEDLIIGNDDPSLLADVLEPMLNPA